MARKLTKLDEWPLHQTIDTFDSVATSTQNWSDGFWNCVGDPDGRVNLITAIRFYQNTNVADGYACVSLDDGKQYNLRCSRRLAPADRRARRRPACGWRSSRGCAPSVSAAARTSTASSSTCCGRRPRRPGTRPRAKPATSTAGSPSSARTTSSSDTSAGPSALRAASSTVDRDWVGARDHSWGLGGDSGTGGRIATLHRATGRCAHSQPQARLRDAALVAGAPPRALDLLLVPPRQRRRRWRPFKSHIDYPFEANRPGEAYRGARVESAEFAGGLRRLERAVVAFERTTAARTASASRW